MHVISELSSEIANAVLLKQKTGKTLEPQEAVAVIKRFHSALSSLRSAEGEWVKSVRINPAAQNIEEKSVGTH